MNCQTYYVSLANTTLDEPVSGWYFVAADSPDNPYPRGPFLSREKSEYACMNVAKTTNERVAKLRADRDALGLKRKEVYVHDDDWPELLKLAKRLERRHAKLLASGAG